MFFMIEDGGLSGKVREGGLRIVREYDVEQ